MRAPAPSKWNANAEAGARPARRVKTKIVVNMVRFMMRSSAQASVRRPPTNMRAAPATISAAPAIGGTGTVFFSRTSKSTGPRSTSVFFLSYWIPPARMPTRPRMTRTTPRIRVMSGPRLDGATALDDADENARDGEHEEQVNEPAQRVVRHHAQQPEQGEDDGDGPQHGILLASPLSFRRVGGTMEGRCSP